MIVDWNVKLSKLKKLLAVAEVERMLYVVVLTSDHLMSTLLLSDQP